MVTCLSLLFWTIPYFSFFLCLFLYSIYSLALCTEIFFLYFLFLIYFSFRSLSILLRSRASNCPRKILHTRRRGGGEGATASRSQLAAAAGPSFRPSHASTFEGFPVNKQTVRFLSYPIVQYTNPLQPREQLQMSLVFKIKLPLYQILFKQRCLCRS